MADSKITSRWLNATVPKRQSGQLIPLGDDRCPILGASRIEQLEANLGAAEFELTNAEMAALDTVSALDVPYPYDSFIDDAQTDR